jgi:putative transposase
MGYRRTPFAQGEWYHCFNRGIDKRSVFANSKDLERFLQLLYLANNINTASRDNFYHLPHSKIFQLPRANPLVKIGAYCLMKNHFHLLLQEVEDGGITKFMHKVGTGYTMYFNALNDRVGNLFVKPFRSKHIKDDRYLRRVVQYIHLNPAETFESLWKKGKVRDKKTLEKKLLEYPHLSLLAYYGQERLEDRILDTKSVDFLKHGLPRLSSVISDAAAYYQEIQTEF